MSFTESIRTCFRKYAHFSGRASRSEYWYFALFAFLVSFVPYIIGIALFASAAESVNTPYDPYDPYSGGTSYHAEGAGAGLAILFWILAFIVGLALFLPQLAAAVRRLHDTGRSGAWFLISFVPFVGPFILLAFLAMAGTPGPNEYDEGYGYAGWAQSPGYGAGGYPPPAYGAGQYGAPQYGAPQYGAPQYGAPQYGTGQYGTPPAPQYDTPQYPPPAYGTQQAPSQSGSEQSGAYEPSGYEPGPSGGPVPGAPGSWQPGEGWASPLPYNPPEDKQ